VRSLVGLPSKSEWSVQVELCVQRDLAILKSNSLLLLAKAPVDAAEATLELSRSVKEKVLGSAIGENDYALSDDDQSLVTSLPYQVLKSLNEELESSGLSMMEFILISKVLLHNNKHDENIHKEIAGGEFVLEYLHWYEHLEDDVDFPALCIQLKEVNELPGLEIGPISRSFEIVCQSIFMSLASEWQKQQKQK
jgi:hypothetical protein